MSCSICGSIETTATANTGREEYFLPPITRMTFYGLGDRDDFWECPECMSVFSWTDYRAQTGSGNNDEETLTRLGAAEAEAIRTIAHDARRLTDDELTALGSRVSATLPGIADLVTTLTVRARAEQRS